MLVAVASSAELIARAANGPPLHAGIGAVELRLDLPGDAAAAVAAARQFAPGCRLIATCRLPADGGAWRGSEAERLALLEAAAKWADLVDLEHDNPLPLPASQVIRSRHIFGPMPRDLRAEVEALARAGGAILKLAVTAGCLSDNLRLRELLAATQLPLAAFAMGDFGIPSRVLALAWGSRLTYGSLGGQALAPGMLAADALAGLYRAHRLTRGSAVFGVTGRHASNSRSPALHNPWLAAAGLDGVYLPLQAESLEDFLYFARELPVQGASVTVPFKEDAARCCMPDAAVTATGACNTLRSADGALEGFNTDVQGFLDDLRAAYARPLAGRSALVLGAGGAARAVLYALRQAGARAALWARRAGQAASLAAQCGCTEVADLCAVRQVDLLVNTTPCGMAGEHAGQMPLPWPDLGATLAADALVYDLVYNPEETPLLAAACVAGFGTANGMGMLRRQAALQAALFGYAPADAPKPPVAVQPHVWLVGYRGSGKSTLAPLLARQMGLPWLDLDQAVERAAGKPIGEIFRVSGEPVFRELEAAALARVASGPKSVIATGGGVIERPDNVRAMRESGVVVWLRAPAAELARRLEENPGGRPSLTGADVAREVALVLARREPLYAAAAHLQVDATQPVPVLAGEIARRLAEFRPR
ncbi:MAG: type I 3-dehydroquinate dehydratase [Planctomycetes bacterium]|nr:type I 3-dehydroquinate dehydratase [Planctomycetota bacterium]